MRVQKILMMSLTTAGLFAMGACSSSSGGSGSPSTDHTAQASVLTYQASDADLSRYLVLQIADVPRVLETTMTSHPNNRIDMEPGQEVPDVDNGCRQLRKLGPETDPKVKSVVESFAIVYDTCVDSSKHIAWADKNGLETFYVTRAKPFPHSTDPDRTLTTPLSIVVEEQGLAYSLKSMDVNTQVTRNGRIALSLASEDDKQIVYAVDVENHDHFQAASQGRGQTKSGTISSTFSGITVTFDKALKKASALNVVEMSLTVQGDDASQPPSLADFTLTPYNPGLKINADDCLPPEGSFRVSRASDRTDHATVAVADGNLTIDSKDADGLQVCQTSQNEDPSFAEAMGGVFH